jgi:hypothetical protein
MAFTSPIAFATIENCLVDWLRTSFDSEVPVLWAKQNRPQSAKPFILLKRVAGPTIVGRDEQRRRMKTILGVPTLFTDIVGQREMTINIQAFTSSEKSGESADSYLAQAQVMLEHDVILNKFETAQISIVDVSSITSLDSIAGAGFESRASFDLTISTVSALIAPDDEPSNWIETVDVSQVESEG